MGWADIGIQIWVVLFMFFLVPGLIAYARGKGFKDQLKYASASLGIYLGACAAALIVGIVLFEIGFYMVSAIAVPLAFIATILYFMLLRSRSKLSSGSSNQSPKTSRIE